MKLRIRTLLVVTLVLAVLVAIPTYIKQSVIPANRHIAAAIMEDIGSRFELTGTYPKASTLCAADISDDLGLPLTETASGKLANRWGQLVDVMLVPTGLGDRHSSILEVMVTSRGPFGFLGPASTIKTFEYTPEDKKHSP